MKKMYLVVLLVVVAIIAAIALLSSKPKADEHASMQPSPTATVEQPADANSVIISNYTFSPVTLKVKKGTKVTWTNHDTVKHDVVSDSSQTVTGPESPLLGKNETFSFTFDSVGTYKYHCSPHPYMHGTVEVTE